MDFQQEKVQTSSKFVQLASGRMWFARFVNGQRTKSKRVNETTFYALIQHFAIILFECKDCEDFLPARHLMSLCFTFFQEGNDDRDFRLSLPIT